MIKKDYESWFEMYSNDDLTNIEEKGLTQKNFVEISKIAQRLYEITLLPFINNEKTITNLSIIHYSDELPELQKLCTDLQKIYDECNSTLINDPILIHRLFENKGLEFNIMNPYPIIPKLIDEMNAFIDKIKYNSWNNISNDNFIFTDKFQLLKTLLDVPKNLNDQDLKDLFHVYLFFMKKGFALNQITIKANENEIIKMKDDGIDVDGQLLSEFNNLWEYFDTIYHCSSQLNEKLINHIISNHSNDEIGKVLKQIADELIPYYKSLITPHGFLKLTIEKTKKYDEILQKYFKDTMYHKAIFPVYLDFIQFKLESPPDDSYYSLINAYIADYKLRFSNIPTDLIFKIVLNSQIKKLSSQGILDHKKNLIKQKYFITWYMISGLLSNDSNKRLSFLDASLILLILPWKIDDSEESQQLEDYFKDISMKMVQIDDTMTAWYNSDFEHLKRDGYTLGDDSFKSCQFDFVYNFNHWSEYLLTNVCTAEKYLDHKKMKHMIKKISKIGMLEYPKI